MMTRNGVRKMAVGGLLLGAICFVPACSLWNGTLRMLMVKTDDDKKQDHGVILADPRGSPETLPPGPVAMVPRVIVYRITAPLGTFSTNEKVWAELNEDALDSKMSVLMAQNGIRAGTGSSSKWQTIVKLIEGPGVQQDQQMCQTDGRSSLNVVTRGSIPDEMVMSIDRDLQQQGRTFERCDNGFKLSMRGIRGKQLLQVQLEPYVALGTVQISRGPTAVGIVGGGFVSEETFADLQMAATLAADQFLVVTAADPKKNPFSVGSLWLSDVDKAPAMETVLIFLPAPGK